MNEQSTDDMQDRAFYGRFFAKREIRSPDGAVYLTRWKIGPFFVHKMHAPDYARALHDHPWDFASLVLFGGYREEIADSGAVGGAREQWNPPGTLLFRGATHTHRVAELPAGTCWTLVLHGPRKRRWGFHSERGWVHWRRYLDTFSEAS